MPADVAADAAAMALVGARRECRRVSSKRFPIESRDDAYAVQDATLAAIGPIGGWKVCAAAPGNEPTCAPLPADGLMPRTATLRGSEWHLRGVEAEIAFVLGADLPPRSVPYTHDDVAHAVASVVPAIEVAETRWIDWLDANPVALLADLLSHGGLVLGEPAPFDRRWFDLSRIEVAMCFDDQVVAHTVGEHAHPDVGVLMAWLANHCATRGAALKAGQVITTGSCTGMLFASEGTTVRAEVVGLAPFAAFF